MSDVKSKKSQADQFRKEQKYESALPIYQELWQEDIEIKNPWIGWGYAFCLEKTNKIYSAIEISNEVKILKNDLQVNNDLLLRNLNRAISEFYYVKSITDEKKFLRTAEIVVSNYSQGNAYSIYNKIVMKVMEYYKKNNRYLEVLNWSNKLEAEKLSDKPGINSNPNVKLTEYASEKETYLRYKIEALYEEGHYENCLALAEYFFNQIHKYHYNNDFHVKRDVAQCHIAMGNVQLGINQLKELLLKKREYYLQTDIAKIYYNMGDLEEVVKFTLDAALNFGDHDKKVNLYLLMAKSFLELNKMDESKIHTEFVYQIRMNEGWNIDNELLSLLSLHNIDRSKKGDLKQIERNIKQLWEKLKASSQVVLTGTITKILPEGNKGFIKADNGKSYFFYKKDFKAKHLVLEVNIRVSFWLQESFDQKKNQSSEIAINIKAIS
ncbi:hypothetical protein GCM10008018_36960 [Paenibacillus marchantiophytorum]|uniref:Tetratricopeptide repeat protein n=1 Tax=Paenibacillus marchantiophytorum TaxID=1619310 RepID=A0ABQ1ETY9_9BACL|nr:hypothetical protein [Paenibacillus marchantiophytorum]GFZ87329.1 hypothetical protein GCM10008018_36960 [Paenibacillus marchantiophytorum]